MRNARGVLLCVRIAVGGLAAMLTLGISACGGTPTATRTVTVTRSVAAPPAAPRSHHRAAATAGTVAHRAAASPSGMDAHGFVHCDPNIKAKAATTTCRFAE